MKWHNLTAEDIEWAKEVGAARDSSADKSGKKHKYGYKPKTKLESLTNHVYGAAAELAAARAMGVPWPAYVDTYKSKPDIEPDWEVRRRSIWEYDCLVRHNDYGRVMHVVGSKSQYCVAGWIHAEDAKLSCWERNHGNRATAFFVPLGELTPLGSSVWHAEDRILYVVDQPSPCCEKKMVALKCSIPNYLRIDCCGCGKFIEFKKSDLQIPPRES